jgi:hypothetical protein
VAAGQEAAAEPGPPLPLAPAPPVAPAVPSPLARLTAPALPAGIGGFSRGRLRAAWAVALAADCLQVVAFPFFWAGAASPADDVLDLVVAAALTALLGWHWSYIPSFLTKLTPAIDLVPTWTGAVYLATRRSVPRGKEPTIVEAEVVRPALAGATPAAAASLASEEAGTKEKR